MLFRLHHRGKKREGEGERLFRPEGQIWPATLQQPGVQECTICARKKAAYTVAVLRQCVVIDSCHYTVFIHYTVQSILCIIFIYGTYCTQYFLVNLQ